MKLQMEKPTPQNRQFYQGRPRVRTLKSLRFTLPVIVLAFLICSASQAATFHVTTTVDNNNNANPTPGSLRKAIVDANNTPGKDTIDFNISGAGVHTLTVTVPLPTISDPVVIDGYTQPGASANTMADGDNRVLLIQLTGAKTATPDGLVITAGSSTVKGLIINGFVGFSFDGSAIRLTGKGQNVIAGNFIGTDPNGTLRVENAHGILIDGSPSNFIGGGLAARNVISGNSYGISIENAAVATIVRGNFIGTDRNGSAKLGNSEGLNIDTNQSPFGIEIGGTAPGDGNVISGNGSGVAMRGNLSGVKIQGNLIGTDVTGKLAVGNAQGLFLNFSGTLNIIGGITASARNVISGNGNGISLLGGDQTFVQGNYIGTDITGKVGLGNTGYGIYVSSNGNAIGGTTTSEGNVISANGVDGIRIADGAKANYISCNFIGLDAGGAAPLGNGGAGIWIENGNDTIIGGAVGAANRIAFNQLSGVSVLKGTGNLITCNQITSNKDLGIDLGTPGSTANDQGDADSGPNNLQNFPVLSRATRLSNGATLVSGTLNSTPNTQFHIDLYRSSSPDASSFGEADVYLGGFDQTTDAGGNLSFSGSWTGVILGEFISATVTDPAYNTSEFSQVKQVTPDQPGSFQFSSAAFSGNENGGQVAITVKRIAGNSGNVSVKVSTVPGGTATPGSDFSANSGVLNWTDGDSADKTFTLPINDDLVDEPDETIMLALTGPTNGATLGSPSNAVLTIVDDDAAPTISIDDVSSPEGNSGTTAFTFTVSLSAASSQTISVNYSTADNPAQAGSDYQAANGVVTFNPGETSKQVTVLVNGDTQIEPNETFAVNLSNLVNASVGKVTGVGTIVNDDSNTPSPTIQFSQATYSVQEDLGAMTVTITRNGDTSATASVDYTTVDGSAVQKADFEYAAGTLTFAAGESSKTVTILLNEDVLVEGAETFSLTLSNPAGAVLGPQSSTTATIVDDLSESMLSPVDDAQSFVYMHYHDFLNREPDAAGLGFWTSQITACGTDARCIDTARVNVSASFFLSIEFQETAYLLYLMQKESYSTSPKYASFMRDLQEVSRGVVVNTPGWQQKLSDNQQRFADQWRSRPEFKAAYDALSNEAYVNALYKNAGIAAPQTEKDKLVAALNTASMNRSAVLLQVAGDATFRQQEQNAAFVMMEYFGYLRRDPSASPDADLSGYNFWLNKLNQFKGNYVDAQMIKAFITSFEYRQRFSQ